MDFWDIVFLLFPTFFGLFITVMLIWIQCGNNRKVMLKPKSSQRSEGVIPVCGFQENQANRPIDEASERNSSVRRRIKPINRADIQYMKSPKSKAAKLKEEGDKSDRSEKKSPSTRTAIPGSALKSRLMAAVPREPKKLTESKEPTERTEPKDLEKTQVSTGFNSTKSSSSRRKSHRISKRPKRMDVMRMENKGADSKRTLMSVNSDRTQSDETGDGKKKTITKTQKERDEWKMILKSVNDESKKKSQRKQKKSSVVQKEVKEHVKHEKQHTTEEKTKTQDAPDHINTSHKRSRQIPPRPKKEEKPKEKDGKFKLDRSTINNEAKQRLNSLRRKVRNALHTKTDDKTSEMKPKPEIEASGKNKRAKKPKDDGKAGKSKMLKPSLKAAANKRRKNAEPGSDNSTESSVASGKSAKSAKSGRAKSARSKKETKD